MKTLKAFGFDCSLQLEPYEFKVRTGAAPRALDLKQLSRSQALRFSVAFQAALAKVTEVNFIVLDEVDMLLEDIRQQLTIAVDEAGLDQVLILLAGKPEKRGTAPEGVAYYDLKLDEQGCSVLCE